MFKADRDDVLLERLASHLGVELPPHGGSWLRYGELTGLWGARVDLTSARDAAMLAELLFLDALVLLGHRLIAPTARIVDVGAGVGAPTLPMLLASPGMTGTLLEPRRKRVAFLRTVVGHFEELPARVHVVEARLDVDDPALPDGPHDVALSRATFDPTTWARLGLSLCPTCVVLTAGDAPELPERATLASRVDYTVPSSGAPRSIFILERR